MGHWTKPQLKIQNKTEERKNKNFNSKMWTTEEKNRLTNIMTMIVIMEWILYMRQNANQQKILQKLQTVFTYASNMQVTWCYNF